MKKVLFHPDASEEMTASAEWYERKQSDLGKRFLAAVQDAVLRVQINPVLYPEVMPGVRRSITRSFPFGVVYSTSDDVIFIFAVMHLRRDPDYWKDRVTG